MGPIAESISVENPQRAIPSQPSDAEKRSRTSEKHSQSSPVWNFYQRPSVHLGDWADLTFVVPGLLCTALICFRYLRHVTFTGDQIRDARLQHSGLDELNNDT